jgi:hypothetical protein
MPFNLCQLSGVVRANRGEASHSRRAAPKLLQKNLAEQKRCGLVKIIII